MRPLKLNVGIKLDYGVQVHCTMQFLLPQSTSQFLAFIILSISAKSTYHYEKSHHINKDKLC